MRLLSTVLFVAFVGGVGIAQADDAKPADTKPADAPAEAKPDVRAAHAPLRVVRIMADTDQALLFDRNHNTHVLVEVGSAVDGLRVTAIDEDAVTLSGEGGVQMVLSTPERWRARGNADEAAPAKPAKTAKPDAGGAQPVDPYTQPVDPYGEPTVRSAEAPAPIAAGENGMRVAEAPGAATATGSAAGSATAAAPVPAAAPVAAPVPAAAPVAAPAPAAAPVAAPAPAPAAAPAPVADVDAPIVLLKSDVTAALGNFGALASALHGEFTPAGVRVDSIAPTSLFAKAGLRAGDVIASVDGHALRTIDDAASLYARAGAAHSFAIQLVRAGKPVALRVAIQ